MVFAQSLSNFAIFAEKNYPFLLTNRDIHIQQIVNLALESDIPQYAGMNVSTGRKLKYLDNTNLIYNLGGEQSEIGNVHETFFFNPMRVNHDVVTSSVSDFSMDGYTFEIGGRKKGKKQIENVANAFVVKDDIEFAFGNTIPLWHFGFSY